MSGREVLEELQRSRAEALQDIRDAAKSEATARADLIAALHRAQELEVPIAEMARAAERPRPTIYDWLGRKDGA